MKAPFWLIASVSSQIVLEHEPLPRKPVTVPPTVKLLLVQQW